MGGHILKSSIKKQHLCLIVGAEGTWAEHPTSFATPHSHTAGTDSSFGAEALTASLRPAGARQGDKRRAAADEKPFLKNEVKIEADLSLKAIFWECGGMRGSAWICC